MIIFIIENSQQNSVCKMVAIMFRAEYLNSWGSAVDLGKNVNPYLYHLQEYKTRWDFWL